MRVLRGTDTRTSSGNGAYNSYSPWVSNVHEADLLNSFGFSADARGVFYAYATTADKYYTFDPATGEARHQLDYSPSGFQGIAVQSLGDQDSDGLADIDENANGTDLFVADSDADGVNDGIEVANGTDPLDSDTDDDGLDDFAEGT
jgi:hypothetical protein